jgi:hypothetical protein
MTDPVTALPTSAISRTYVDDGKKVGKAKTLVHLAGSGDSVGGETKVRGESIAPQPP